jgi:hypothetical protein
MLSNYSLKLIFKKESDAFLKMVSILQKYNEDLIKMYSTNVASKSYEILLKVTVKALTLTPESGIT